MTENPKFLVKDLSGRGFAATLSLEDIQAKWDLGFSNDPANESEPTLGEWLKEAEIGEAFFHQEDHVSFIRVV